MRAKNYAEAQQWMAKGLLLEPGSVEMHIDQANLQMRMNNNQDAINTLELALKLAHSRRSCRGRECTRIRQALRGRAREVQE